MKKNMFKTQKFTVVNFLANVVKNLFYVCDISLGIFTTLSLPIHLLMDINTNTVSHLW